MRALLLIGQEAHDDDERVGLLELVQSLLASGGKDVGIVTVEALIGALEGAKRSLPEYPSVAARRDALLSPAVKELCERVYAPGLTPEELEGTRHELAKVILGPDATRADARALRETLAKLADPGTADTEKADLQRSIVERLEPQFPKR